MNNNFNLEQLLAVQSQSCEFDSEISQLTWQEQRCLREYYGSLFRQDYMINALSSYDISSS